MSGLSNDFILGCLMGYFLYNYFVIFLLGFAVSAVIQEKYGSINSFLKWGIERVRHNTFGVYRTYIRRDNSPIEPSTELKVD
jgi:hypothetical protein